MRSLPGAALLFNAFLLICLRNIKFLLLIYFFGGVALPPRFLQWSVNFLKSQQMVRERQTRISTENNDISREVKCNKFGFNCFKLSAGWLDAYNQKYDKNCEYCPTNGSLRFKSQDENVSTTALQCSEDAEIKISLTHTE